MILSIAQIDAFYQRLREINGPRLRIGGYVVSLLADSSQGEITRLLKNIEQLGNDIQQYKSKAHVPVTSGTDIGLDVLNQKLYNVIWMGLLTREYLRDNEKNLLSTIQSDYNQLLTDRIKEARYDAELLQGQLKSATGAQNKRQQLQAELPQLQQREAELQAHLLVVKEQEARYQQ